MSKSDSSPGFLSKMVKFVRHPVTNWSELDAGASEQDEGLSKQLLKEMIERKRQNDAVRKREFDMLRKLRKREALSGTAQDAAERPSFFQSSLPSRPDDRAQTIKKIDEIEAQMSSQWWRTKGGGIAAQPSTHLPLTPQPAALGVQPPPPTNPSFSGAFSGEQSRPDHAAPRHSLEPGRSNVSQTSETAVFSSGTRPSDTKAADKKTPSELPTASKNSSFTSSQFDAVDFSEAGIHDPELEEVAIRFANGDDASAEAGLLEILGLLVGIGGERAQHLESWMALFDLYRATGQQEKFEVAALQFVQRFERSAPQWLYFLGTAAANLPTKTEAKSAADWVCPAVFGNQSLVALKAVMAKVPSPWHLDWRSLKSIEPAVLSGLRDVFSTWANQDIALRFTGVMQLNKLLENATPAGDAQVDKLWWNLRLEFLRVTQQSEVFEMVALDFCVTYEVSPPSWDRPRCTCNIQTAKEGDAKAGELVYKDTFPSTLTGQELDTTIEGYGLQNHPERGELFGEIQGDTTEILAKLDIRFAGADRLVVSCACLVRIDFSAAGALLNWVCARQAEKRVVQFLDVHRLVLAFFNVVGITEHAAVHSRID